MNNILNTRRLSSLIKDEGKSNTLVKELKDVNGDLYRLILMIRIDHDPIRTINIFELDDDLVIYAIDKYFELITKKRLSDYEDLPYSQDDVFAGFTVLLNYHMVRANPDSLNWMFRNMVIRTLSYLDKSNIPTINNDLKLYRAWLQFRLSVIDGVELVRNSLAKFALFEKD